jgi:hypothetical protein
MFADYKSLIVAGYQEKIASNILPLRLVQPTPANLKKECLAVFEERYLKKDEKALREFFGPVGEKSTRLESIDNHDINKFKPLVKFLKKPTGSPGHKNIEILAWLIDFEPRPFELGRKYKPQAPAGPESTSVNIQDETKLANDEKALVPDQPTNSPDPIHAEPMEASSDVDNCHPPPTPGKRRKAIAILALLPLALIAIGIYWLLARKAFPPSTPSSHQNPLNTTVVVFDSGKINHVNKITNWDTITLGSIRNVWYFKSHGELELYTSPGLYPLDQRFRLLPLTKYMYEKYVVPKQHTPTATSN